MSRVRLLALLTVLAVLVPVAGTPGAAPAARAQQPLAEPLDCPGVTPVDPADVPVPEEFRADLRRAHAIATGAGVTVAVIDTGISPHPRLPALIAGGDLVGAHRQEGLPGEFIDCDGHGTIIAGIIAARADPGSGWPHDGSGDTHLGIAPDAGLIAIKQTSAYARSRADTPVGTLSSLSDSIHRAIDLGAQVINISVVSCLPTGAATPDSIAPLTGALQRAEDDGVIIVAASGNLGRDCPPGSTVYPAHSATVLSVSARSGDHAIADYSVPGPPQLLSAPGFLPGGLSPRGEGFVSAMRTTSGESPFEGTSFAAPVVSATAALLRQRHPGASAQEIRDRILGSAEPARGAFSPFAALTHEPTGAVPDSTPVAIPAPGPPDQQVARRTTGLSTMLLVLLALVTAVLGWWRRQPRSLHRGSARVLPRFRSEPAPTGPHRADPSNSLSGISGISGSDRASRRTHPPRAGSRHATSPRN